MRLAYLVLFACVSVMAVGQSAMSPVTLPLWTNAGVDAERDLTTEKDNLIAGRRVQRLTDVSHPTVAFYGAPAEKNSGATVVVFPGGGYQVLAYDLEGTEVCEWLHSIGVNCALVKYRVPQPGPYPKGRDNLADAQRAMRLVRSHAAEWKIDPKRVGVLGFSAGGHLAVLVSNRAEESAYSPADDVDKLSAQPDFAVIVYPGYLVRDPDLTKLSPEVQPSAATPPTFLIQAEDDQVHVENVTVYFEALKRAKVPAELHVYAKGGHGYGLRPTQLPVTHWPGLVETWLHTIGVLQDTAMGGSR